MFKHVECGRSPSVFEHSTRARKPAIEHAKASWWLEHTRTGVNGNTRAFWPLDRARVAQAERAWLCLCSSSAITVFLCSTMPRIKSMLCSSMLVHHASPRYIRDKLKRSSPMGWDIFTGRYMNDHLFSGPSSHPIKKIFCEFPTA